MVCSRLGIFLDESSAISFSSSFETEILLVCAFALLLCLLRLSFLWRGLLRFRFELDHYVPAGRFYFRYSGRRCSWNFHGNCSRNTPLTEQLVVANCSEIHCVFGTGNLLKFVNVKPSIGCCRMRRMPLVRAEVILARTLP